MYGGRVLKHGKSLSDYHIVGGVTIFYIKNKGMYYNNYHTVIVIVVIVVVIVVIVVVGI